MRSTAWTTATRASCWRNCSTRRRGASSSTRHKWRTGDVVMWDNRAMLHRGRPWDYGKERSMVRTTISATVADGLNEVKPPVLH